MQLVKAGELVKVYPSIKVAAEETGINAVNINHCIHKHWRAKSAGGFLWKKYADYDMEQFLKSIGAEQ